MGRRAANGTSIAIARQIIVARLVAILVVALAIAGVGDALLAQAASGTIHGVVHEQAAAALRGVAVTATNVETGFRRRVISGAGGRFTVAGLPAGVYELSAVLDGFAEGRQAGIVLRPGDAFATRLQLRKAPLAETITLTDARSGLERMRGHAASGFPTWLHWVT